MHEASLITGLMRRVEATAMAEKATHITAVAIWIGALSHMSAEHFAEHFQHASAGTAAEGARLDVTMSDDIHHPHALDIRLESVEVET
jgi:hydrogenase nickel incorporation protein HypA/HybF